MLDFGDRETAENRVAVMPFPQAHVPLIRPVGQIQSFPEEIHLPVMARAGHPVVHFLQEHNVRLVVGQRFDDALRAVQAVHAADALMDVIGYETELHETVAPSSASSATVSISLASERIRVG